LAKRADGLEQPVLAELRLQWKAKRNFMKPLAKLG